MNFKFEWNPYADQPHNVAPKSDRLRRHLHHAGSYLALAASNFRRAIPALSRYRKYMRQMYRVPVAIGDAFGCAVSPAGPNNAEIFALLEEAGVKQTLVRLPSWDKDVLVEREAFVRDLKERGYDVCLALLQRREDVLDPPSWRRFLEEAFSRFAPLVSVFEIGHAWNRTKWGVWDYREYLDLAEPAFDLAPRYGAKLAGPAVIDFEFHLYPATLSRLPFDKITSLLYVDRTGAPESPQCGWDTTMKIALLKAVVDSTARADREIWITEVNWPLAGTGPYSPAAGKPNVSEEEAADYLIRYYVLCLASGLIERIYWWQLVAPGYGLIDSLIDPWRRRPGFYSFKELRSRLEGSVFIGREAPRDVNIFRFKKSDREVAVCWTAGAPKEYTFNRRVEAVFDRDGHGIFGPLQKIAVNGSPKYVVLSDENV